MSKTNQKKEKETYQNSEFQFGNYCFRVKGDVVNVTMVAMGIWNTDSFLKAASMFTLDYDTEYHFDMTNKMVKPEDLKFIFCVPKRDE